MDVNKTKAIIKAKLHSNKGIAKIPRQVNYLRRFISNLAGRVVALFDLLQLKMQEMFEVTKMHQKAFVEIKNWLINPSILVPLFVGVPLKLCLSIGERLIGHFLV